MKRIFVSLFLMLGLSACALSVDEVDLGYTSKTNPVVVGGADAVTVQVTANDARTSYRDRIGSKKNGYGMEMAAIVSKQAVPDLVAKSLETELAARGFRLGKGSVFVLVDVSKFYNDFKTGFWTAQAAGEVMLNVQVLNASGKLFYARSYTGEHTVPDVMMMGGENAKTAMQGALSDAMARMMDDQYLIQAVIEAGRAGPSAAVPVSSPNS